MVEQTLKLSCDRALVNSASWINRGILDGKILPLADEVEEAAEGHLSGCGEDDLCIEGHRLVLNYKGGLWVLSFQARGEFVRDFIRWENGVAARIGENGNRR